MVKSPPLFSFVTSTSDRCRLTSNRRCWSRFNCCRSPSNRHCLPSIFRRIVCPNSELVIGWPECLLFIWITKPSWVLGPQDPVAALEEGAALPNCAAGVAIRTLSLFFFLLRQPLSDVWWLPTNRHRLHTNRHRLPTNRHRLPTNCHQLPTGRHHRAYWTLRVFFFIFYYGNPCCAVTLVDRGPGNAFMGSVKVQPDGCPLPGLSAGTQERRLWSGGDRPPASNQWAKFF